MCHYYLPTKLELNDQSSENKYGEYAIKNLLKLFKVNSSNPMDLEAKIIGGGHVIDFTLNKEKDIGGENIDIARRILSEFNIRVTALSVGDNVGRKVKFNTITGTVEVQKIESSRNNGHEESKIKVLIVDDSSTVRKLLSVMINRDPIFQIIGQASDPFEADDIIKNNRPDLITLDIKMPKMDGITYLEKRLSKIGIPTIMISAIDVKESGYILRALELGAFDFIRKPTIHDIEGLTLDLHEKLKQAFKNRKSSIKPQIYNPKIPRQLYNVSLDSFLIVVGASTGGTEAIKAFLTRLPPEIPPVLIVQHIPKEFCTPFVEKVNEICSFPVQEAKNNTVVKSSNVYFAPGGLQMKVMNLSKDLVLKLVDDPPVQRFKPSVDYLFQSVCNLKSRKIIAVMLTGMGEDGAHAMKKLRNLGAFTIAQDESSSVVFGMPKAAIDLGAADKVLHLNKISDEIVRKIHSW